jgi:NTE family protein
VGFHAGELAPNANSADETVAIVLAGGGARGAYEMGALSVLLQRLDETWFRKTVLVGSSVGSINAMLVGSVLDRGPTVAAQEGLHLWQTLDWPSVTARLLSLRGLAPFARYGAGIMRPSVRIDRLLDSRPLAKTLAKRLDVKRLAANIGEGKPKDVAIVATQTETAYSVVFHPGPKDDRDTIRRIRYVRAELTLKHVLASSAMPALFPPVWIRGPGDARGWYVDGSVRINTPIKPALELGADRLIVIAACTARPGTAGGRAPDIFDGVGQVAQAALGDPLLQDIATLAKRSTDKSGREIPYILIAPSTGASIGEIAQRVYLRHYATLTKLGTSPGLLGRLLQAAKSSGTGELFSYLFFAREFFDALIAEGSADAHAWFDAAHDAGEWQIGPLP